MNVTIVESVDGRTRWFGARCNRHNWFRPWHLFSDHAEAAVERHCAAYGCKR